MPGSPARPCPRYTASGSGRDTRPACSASPQTCDQRVELPDLWGRHGVVAAERLLTDPAKLTEAVGENLRELSDPAVAELLARLEVGVPRVSSAIRDLAVSERQLRRRFTVAVGYGPATYLRVARLQRAIARASSAGTLASLAAEAGLCRPGAPQPGLPRTDRHHARRVLPQDVGHRGRTSPIW
jgi:AraC-like DNA-binding protein